MPRTRVANRNDRRAPTRKSTPRLAARAAFRLQPVAAMRWVSLALLLAACGNDRGGDTGFDYAANKGTLLYHQMCQVCHGETGEGGIGPALLDTPRSVDELRSAIATRMPANNPGQCTGDCADTLATFIKAGLTTRALRCDRVPPGPRQLRLLTRREYRATVADLFGAAAPAMSCARPSDCAYRDSCDAGACQPSACDAQTFVYDPHGRALTSVHVAGSFNNWAPTIAGGGLPLVNTGGQWVGTFALGEGTYQYKLVLNESEWVEDPRAPSSVPDGFGGHNAQVQLACVDPASRVPAENRPAGFPFDTEADTALVTAQHVDAYLAAAEPLADFAAAHAPCSAGDAACARQFVIDLGRRVFRRPLSGDESSQYGELAAADVATAVHALLVSPHFLYRSELGEKHGDHYELTGYELATALSYTFLGTTPSTALLDAAAGGELADAAGVERWARRLIDDPRARAQVGEFALQWTGGQAVMTVDKRPDWFPGFDGATRTALANETRRFATDVVFDGSGVFEDLLTADYTILDPIAAKFYGVTGTGHVPYGDGRRAGVFGHASLLATTAHSDQTSPIRRGLLVRRNFLCEELPPPPPFAGPVPNVDPSTTARERFAMHTANPVCAGCHQYIDRVGFGFEHFDPVGHWRDTENGKPIDASGDLNDIDRLGSGTDAPYQTLPELAQAVAHSAAAPSCFTRQYLRFTRGVSETLANRCDRRWIEDRFAAAHHDVREMMIQSVLAPDFKVRR